MGRREEKEGYKEGREEGIYGGKRRIMMRIQR